MYSYFSFFLSSCTESIIYISIRSFFFLFCSKTNLNIKESSTQNVCRKFIHIFYGIEKYEKAFRFVFSMKLKKTEKRRRTREKRKENKFSQKTKSNFKLKRIVNAVFQVSKHELCQKFFLFLFFSLTKWWNIVHYFNSSFLDMNRWKLYGKSVASKKSN